MDYDRYDAFLHHVFKQTQSDAWFRPPEDTPGLSPGVCLRVDAGCFRVFPYDNPELEPFAAAVATLDLVVAVKVRSAAIHAALADIPLEDKSLYVDANTRIQVLDTILHLPQADKEQSAAFIRDERSMIVWSDDLDAIIPTCRDLEERLIKLLWRSRPDTQSASLIASNLSLPAPTYAQQSRASTPTGTGLNSPLQRSRDIQSQANIGRPGSAHGPTHVKRDSRNSTAGLFFAPGTASVKRPVRLFAAVYTGLAGALAFYFTSTGVSIVIREVTLDGGALRYALLACVPALFCVSLFFTMQIIQNISFCIGPVAQYYENSKYYSAVPPPANHEVDDKLPHITIQMPVYKESLAAVLAPSITSLKRAMQTYARQGGTAALFVNDDGLQVISPEECKERISFYERMGVGWVARPGHGAGHGSIDSGSSGNKGKKGASPEGFVRAGRFKKASNMNFALALSLRVERHLAILLRARAVGGTHTGMLEEEDLEERALQLALEEAATDLEPTCGENVRPWAARARAIRMGEIVLLVDADTRVPEDCLRDAARELSACPSVAILQHESDVMQVAHHYFENGIAYFTRRVNRCISMSCANGEVAPFVGHNAFMRWRALQDAALIDPVDGQEKIWSESNVSEDFDMALRLMMKGYIIRWATYGNGDFKEGVSLTADDELNRWQKYAYGCSELLFNPVIQWWRKGPINHQIHKFMWSNAPMHYKISMMSYMFSYYGIAASVTISVINYILLGWQLPVDDYYMHSFEIWLATSIVFLGLGNVAITLLEYRLGQGRLFKSFMKNITWLPFFFLFFGGLSIHLSLAILAHLFSYNMTWSATRKEVERSNFFLEVPRILRRFRIALSLCFVLLAAMVVMSTPVVPVGWRIEGDAWAVVFPLSVTLGCHILFPIILNPWLMIFSY
ncbi:hypothetical protein BD410DRAFT_769953 [Rickenella mellea]|uniref:Uncharacterized protein n=1 Tax=Rickenella mellea TaxID=50990 RepID=A0A4Y7Q4A7_9AGAM|nr:hypothetical protein BD410DRAFT_769953 [Rickenella mellea]